MSNITLYGLDFEVINTNRNHALTSGNNIIHDCNFKCDIKPWGGGVLNLPANDPEGRTEIYDCLFNGNGDSGGYGHSSAAIQGIGTAFYNIIIHHNTFNHPTGRACYHGGAKGRAVTFYNNYSAPSTMSNVHLYCNQYLGAGDTLVNCTEEPCP